MKFSLRSFPPKHQIKGIPILVRVDWNVPPSATQGLESSLKLERTASFIKAMSKRGAIVILLTHLGRPKRRNRIDSTRPLARRMKRYGLNIVFHPESVSKPAEFQKLSKALSAAAQGSVHLLENVRFEAGEEKNDKKLAKAWASLGYFFVNDAFASCHRAHASVVGIAKILPSYAGPSLIEEVSHLVHLIDKPAKPFVAVIGGKKLSTKLPVIHELLKTCDKVLIGGAMATPLLAAQKREIGKSYMEKESLLEAKRLLKHKEIVLPVDAVVTEKMSQHPSLKRVSVDGVGRKDIIVDIGPKTLMDWAAILKGAKTILWNGPVGLSENHACGAGSRFIARVIAARAKGKTFGVAGGGDTLPVIAESKTAAWFDFVSTGGGAMLEFIAMKGRLPGILALMK